MDRPSRVKLSGELEGDYVVLAERGNGSLLIAPVPAGGAPVVVALEKTCPACPAQWEGELDDGRSLYARYRGGVLSVGVGDDIEGAVRNSWSEEAFYFEHVGDCLDGFMNFAELRAHLDGLLEFPAELVVEGESGWGAEPIGVARPDGLPGELDDTEDEQPPVTCIGMISSGRGDLSARASRDEFEPPPSR